MSASKKDISNPTHTPAPDQNRGELLNFKWGTLSIGEIRGILDALPMDLNFIDKDDLVQYYNESSGQVHQRDQAVLGTHVLGCHSEASRKKVTATLEALRSGDRDIVTSRGEAHGRPALWRYLAVRNTAGEYLGAICLTEYTDQ
jgi:uncharacterized protein